MEGSNELRWYCTVILCESLLHHLRNYFIHIASVMTGSGLKMNSFTARPPPLLDYLRLLNSQFRQHTCPTGVAVDILIAVKLLTRYANRDYFYWSIKCQKSVKHVNQCFLKTEMVSSLMSFFVQNLKIYSLHSKNEQRNQKILTFKRLFSSTTT